MTTAAKVSPACLQHQQAARAMLLCAVHPRMGSGRRAGAACASAVYRSFVMPVPPVAKGMPMMIDSDTPANEPLAR
jgi:hypothetical protein